MIKDAGIKYTGKESNELAQFLLGKSNSVDFVEPAPTLERSDSLGIRKRILELTQIEAQELGIGKSTLHYLRKNAGRERSFRIYKATDRKLGRGAVLLRASTRSGT